MNAAAVEVVKQFQDIVVAYGQSDEYRYDVATSLTKNKPIPQGEREKSILEVDADCHQFYIPRRHRVV